MLILAFPSKVTLSRARATLPLVLRVKGVLWCVFVALIAASPVMPDVLRISLDSQALVALSGSSSRAGEAPSSLGAFDQIVRREWMARRAMRLSGVEIGDMARGEFREVLFSGDRPEVLRIDAPSVLANVVQLKAIRNWSDEQFIGDFVGITASAVMKEPPGSCFPDAGHERPTLVVAVDIDFFHKPSEHCFRCHAGNYLLYPVASQHQLRDEMRLRI